jgi:hypothetical protein
MDRPADGRYKVGGDFAVRLPCSLVLALTLLPLALASRPASAQPPSADLLARLAASSDAFEEIFKRATFTMEEEIDGLDGDGKVAETKSTKAHTEWEGTTRHKIVDRCLKDGKDITAGEQEEIRKKEMREGGAKGPRLRSPFLRAEQSRYVFEQTAVDPSDPARVEIAFSPKKADTHTVEGSAWVDTGSGNVLSAGAKMSKTPMFVDWVHITVELGAPTPLGPGISRLTFEAKGGLLFLVHKHVRGEITFSDYRIGR